MSDPSLVTPTTWWDKVKCFFGHHLWWEEWPDDWPLVDSQLLGTEMPRMITPEDHKRIGWTRKCLNCGKAEKREAWG
jgi:hypothetical protein